MKRNSAIMIHNVLHESIVCEWDLSVLEAVNSVSQVSDISKANHLVSQLS